MKMSDWFTVIMTANKALHVPAKSGKLRGFPLFFPEPSFALRKRYELLSAFAELETTCHQQSIFRSEFYSVFRRLIVCLS